MNNYKRLFSLFMCFIFIMFSCFFSFPVSANSVNENGELVGGLPDNGKIYRIYTLADRVIDVMNALTADNSTVWTYPYTGAACQEWQVEYVGGDYALKDTNSGKYLTVKNSSSADGAELVITEKNGSFTNGQLFRITQYGSSMRYKLLTKCSGYTKAICTDGYYLKQMPSSNYNTQMYFTEAAVYHGIREGNIHILTYNDSFSLHDRYLGIVNGDIDIGEAENTHIYSWTVKYEGHGYFSLSNNGLYLGVSGAQQNRPAMLISYLNNNYCLWKISVSNDIYTLIPKSAVTGNISTALGILNSTIKMMNRSADGCRWRIIREHYYYPYYATIYAAEDYGHLTYSNGSSHGEVFQSAVPAFYLRGFNNQKLLWQTDADPPDAADVVDLIKHSRVFVFRGHGTSNSILLNARNANGHTICSTGSSEETITISAINSLSPGALSSTQLCVFICCSSAEGAYEDPDASNIVTAVINKGCAAAIGFDGTVDCDFATLFSDILFQHYSEVVGSPTQSGRLAFLSALDDLIDYYLENNKPIYKSSSINITLSNQ